ncbi:hypothetical protein AZ044_003115, partial [Pluralibacter gergoviae]
MPCGIYAKITPTLLNYISLTSR